MRVVRIVDPAKTLLGCLKVAIVAGRHGHLTEPERHVSEVDLDFRNALFVFLLIFLFIAGFLRCIRGFCRVVRLVVFRFLFSFLFVGLIGAVGMQLVRRQERRAQIGNERQLVDLYLVIEEGIGLRASPRAIRRLS